MKRIALLSIVLLLTQGLVAQKSKTETTKAKARQYSYELKYKNVTHEDWLAFVKDIVDRLEKTKNT
ncbi:MAG: hypothetical protein UHN41_03080, partial [Bacteroidales bacterium]|nr:hypothetical protein [Bacteroidales bacterium]